MKKILIVGLGSIGKRHVNNLLSHFNVKIIIFSKRKDLKSLNKKGVIIHNTLSECLKHKPEIGFITNETSFHVETATQLAKNGLDLFIEKPLSDSNRGISVLNKIIKKKKLVVQIGCNLRFHPCIKKIKKIIEKGTLGRIISVQVENGSYLPDWHPYEDYRYGYAARRDLGGGVILTMIHELDYLHWFFGKVDNVFSITGKFSDLEVSADDLSTIILQFKNKVIGEIHLDYFQRPEYRSCKIKGTKGIVYWDSDSNEVKIYYRTKKKWKTVLNLQKYDKNKMYVDELKHFMTCLKNRKKAINDIKDGIETLGIVLAAKKSSKLKKLVRI